MDACYRSVLATTGCWSDTILRGGPLHIRGRRKGSNVWETLLKVCVTAFYECYRARQQHRKIQSLPPPMDTTDL